MKWISVDYELPAEPDKYNQRWVDAWADGDRFADVNFFDGEFHYINKDYQGDFDGYVKIDRVTHWMMVQSPQ